MRKSILFATLVLLLSFTGSLAQIPRTINYQGVLTDAGGEAVPDGNYNLTFRIYNTASGGTALWTEGLLVSVSKGIFNVTLGKVVPLTLPFDDQYWLGITVGAAAELSPRVEFTSSAYSMIAHTVVDDAVTGDKISNGSVVRSVNTLTDQVTLSAGTNMSITPSGNTLVFSSSGTGALDLPYNDSVTSGSTAFGITNYGTGRAGSFLISNATNSNQAVYAETNGTGRAGHFRITNAANDLESVAASTVGGGAALSGYTVGGGDALSAQTDGDDGYDFDFGELRKSLTEDQLADLESGPKNLGQIVSASHRPEHAGPDSDGPTAAGLEKAREKFAAHESNGHGPPETVPAHGRN